MKKILKKCSFLIGFILLIIIIRRFDLGAVYEAFKKTNYQLLILAFLFTIPVILIKAWRWNYLKKLQGIKYKLGDSFLMYWIGMVIGFVTPGRLGEVSKIGYLKNDGYSTGQSLVSVVMDRLLDLLFLISFGYLGIIFFFGFFKKITLIASTIILSIIVLIFISRKQFYKRLIKKIFLAIIPLKYRQSWQINFQDFLDGVKIYNKKNYFYLFLITFLSWIFYYCQVYLFAQSIGLTTVPFLYLIMAVTASGFITLLPLSFLGIGTRETTLIILLAPLTAKPETVILLSELILVTFFFATILGIIFWAIKPLPLTQIFSAKRTIKSK